MSWADDSKPLRDDEYPEPDEDDDGDETYSCPECGAPVYEDAIQCPNCSAYVSPSVSLWSRRPTVWIVLGLLGIVGTLMALIGWVR